MGLLDRIGQIFDPVIDLFEPIGEGAAKVMDTGFRTVNQVMSDPRAAAAVIISIAAPGIGTSIGNAILSSVGVSAAAYPTASLIIGNTIVNGILTGDAEQALKSSVAAAVAPQIGSKVAGFFDNPVASKMVNEMTTAAAKAAIEGKNFDQISKEMASAGLSNAASYFLNQIPGANEASPEVKRAVTDAINTAVQSGGQVSIGDRLRYGLMQGAVTYGVSQLKMDGKPLSPESQNLFSKTLYAALADKPVDQAIINATVQNLNTTLQRSSSLKSQLAANVGQEEAEKRINNLSSELMRFGGGSDYFNTALQYMVESTTPEDVKVANQFQSLTGRLPTGEELQLALSKGVDESVLGDTSAASEADRLAIAKQVFGDEKFAPSVEMRIADPRSWSGTRPKTEAELLAEYNNLYNVGRDRETTAAFRDVYGRDPTEQELTEYGSLYRPGGTELRTALAESKTLADEIFEELKQQFADADPREIRSIADTAAAETVRSDVTESTDDIDRFKKALQPGGMQIFTESQAEGLRNVVNQMRAAGISDDIIEEELVKAQSRDPNFSSFLQSKSPTALSNLPVKMQPRENEVADDPIVDPDGTVRVTIRGKTETGQEYSYVSVMDPEDKSVFYEASSIDPSGGGRTTVSDTRPSFDKGTEQATTIKSPEDISKPTLPDKPIGSIFGYGFEPDSAAGRALFGPGSKGGGPDLGEVPLLFRLVTVDPGTGLKVYDTNNPEFSLLVLKDGTMKLANNTYPPVFIDLTSSEAGEVAPSVAAADTRAEAEQRQQAAADEADTKEAAKTEEPAPQLIIPAVKPSSEPPPKATEEVKPTPEPVTPEKPVEEVKPEPAKPVEEVKPPEKPVEEVKPTAPQGPVAEVVTPPVQPAPVEPTPVQPTPIQPAPVEPTPAAPTPVQPTPVQPTPVQPAPAGVSQQEMQNAINKAVGDAQAEGKAGDAALQAGIDKVASDLGITKDIVLESVGKSEAQLRQEMQAGQAQTAGQIAETEKTLRTEIGKLGSDFQSKFDAMSDAQKAEVDARAKQGQDLQTAINDVGRAATEKIAGVETSISNLDKKLSDAISDARQQGLEGDAALQSAINKVSEESGRGKEEILGQLGRTEAQLRSDFGSQLEAAKQTISTGFSDLDKRISDLVATGKSYQDATTQALTELGGQFESYKSAQEKAAEDAKKAAEEAAKEEEEKTKSKNLFNLSLSLLGGAGMAGASPLASLISGGAGGVPAPPAAPKQVKDLYTGESSGTEFESPLAAFQRLVDPRLAPAPTQEPNREKEMGYFSYGQDTNVEDVLGLNEESQVEAASGGSIVPMMAKGGLSMVHYAGKPRIDFRQGSYVQGPGDGQSDDIPAMLADGEYVFDAEIVSALGNGSNKAGAQLLDKMREHIRAHKRSGSLKKIPPPAKSPLEYLAMAKKGK